jgi:DNA-binding SARP family transcriptional activator
VQTSVSSTTPRPSIVERPEQGAGTVTFGVLGPVRAAVGHRPVDLGSPQQRAILAVLLLHEGAVVGLDSLAAAMWGDAPPRSSATTIRTYISRLRQILDTAMPAGQVEIRSLAGGYALSVRPEALDTVRFRRLTARAADAMRHQDAAGAERDLRAALNLPAGTPLAGLPGPYAARQRTRLLQLLTEAQINLVEAGLRLGRHREILPDVAGLAAAHPMWERPQELLLIALHHSGRQAEALTHYQVTRQRLVDELGIDPGSRLRELHHRILLGRPRLIALSEPTEVKLRPTRAAGGRAWRRRCVRP